MTKKIGCISLECEKTAETKVRKMKNKRLHYFIYNI